jgi:hypothetical protein
MPIMVGVMRHDDSVWSSFNPACELAVFSGKLRSMEQK